jgi:hypothetical protein
MNPALTPYEQAQHRLWEHDRRVQSMRWAVRFLELTKDTDAPVGRQLLVCMLLTQEVLERDLQSVFITRH